MLFKPETDNKFVETLDEKAGNPRPPGPDETENLPLDCPKKTAKTGLVVHIVTHHFSPETEALLAQED